MHDVEHHAQPTAMAAVHETLERVGPAVILGNGVPADSVIAPVPGSVDGVDRHHLDQVDAQPGQVVETLDRGVERPVRGERPDVQLVEHAARQRPAGPASIGPFERAVVIDPRCRVHSVGCHRDRGSGSGVSSSSSRNA